MKRLLLGLALAAVTSSALATVIDTSGLSAEQISALKAQAADMQAKPASVVDKAVEVSSAARGEGAKWADLGNNIGLALIATAKQMGMAINEFSQTGIGRVATALIVYKLVGPDIIHIFAGTIMLIGLPTLIILTRSYMMDTKVEYEYVPRTFFFIPYQKRIVKTRVQVGGSDAMYIFFWTCAFTIFSVIISIVVLIP